MSVRTDEMNSSSAYEKQYSVTGGNQLVSKEIVRSSMVVNVTLTEEYRIGSLQGKVQRKEIDPHQLIHKAILENSAEVVRFLLNQGVDVNYPDQNGMSPLTIAILNRCHFAVDVLLEKGANVNPKTKWNGMSLLELAFSMKDTHAAMLLVKYGTDLRVKNKNGDGVLSCTMRLAYMDRMHTWGLVAKEMIERGANMEDCVLNDAPLWQAIWVARQTKDQSLLRLMISKGVNLNMVQKDKEGKDFSTPLLTAIRTGSLELVKLVVEAGSDVNQTINFRDCKLISPLTQAMEEQHPEIVQYLLQKGARN
jgi:uncharacterized protein